MAVLLIPVDFTLRHFESELHLEAQFSTHTQPIRSVRGPSHLFFLRDPTKGLYPNFRHPDISSVPASRLRTMPCRSELSGTCRPHLVRRIYAARRSTRQEERLSRTSRPSTPSTSNAYLISKQISSHPAISTLTLTTLLSPPPEAVQQQ